MKAVYDEHHQAVKFQVRDEVLLWLKQYQQLSLANWRYQKHLAKFYGPFTILQCIEQIAYKLELPADSGLHSIFHVSNLRVYCERQDASNSQLPACQPEAETRLPLAILDHQTHAGQQEVLVHWHASWEFVTSLQTQFPEFTFEDKRVLEEGRNDSRPLQIYSRYTHGRKKGT